MAGEKDYYSFDEVLKDLAMEEDELKRLVSAGEIRAFRDKDTMRFKAEDIERIRGAEDGDDLDLDLGDELDLGDDLDLDLGDGDELILEDDEPALEEVDLAASARGAERSAASAGSSPQRRVPRSKATDQATEETTEGTGMQVLLVVGFVILVFANFAALGAVSGQTNALTSFLSDFFSG